MRQRPRHRHLVALPFLALVMASSMPFAVGSLHASLIGQPAAESDPDVHTLSDGTVVVTQDGGAFRVDGAWVVPEQGTLLLAGNALVNATYQDMDVLGWNGAYTLAVNGDVLTVAALTSPVVVRRDAERVVVPVGMQWRSDVALTSDSSDLSSWMQPRLPLPLPSSYVQQQHAVLRTLSLPMPVVTAPATISLPASLQFPEARRRSATAEVGEHVDAVLQQMGSADVATLRALLSDAQTVSALSAPEAADALPALLHAATQREGLVTYVLPFVAEDRDLWLLTSFHPSTQAAAWTLPAPVSARADDALLRLMLLPASDRLSRPISGFTYDRWSMDLRDAVVADEHPDALLRALTPVVSSALDTARVAGYEHRASDLLRAFTRVGAAKGVSEDVRVALAGLADQAASPVAADALPIVAVLSEDDAHSLAQKAAALLAAVGAGEGHSTEYRAVDGHTVVVRDALFADVPYSFTFDLRTDTFSDIVSGEHQYPHATVRADFAAWALQQQAD